MGNVLYVSWQGERNMTPLGFRMPRSKGQPAYHKPCAENSACLHLLDPLIPLTITMASSDKPMSVASVPTAGASANPAETGVGEMGRLELPATRDAASGLAWTDISRPWEF